MKRMLISLVVSLALIFSVAPAASAEQHWFGRYNSDSDRDRVSDDMVVGTTVKWESGSTKPNKKGKPLVRPVSINFRGNYESNDEDCGSKWGGLEYVNFKPEFHDASGMNFYPLWRRIKCEDDGNFYMTVKFPKKTTPVFRYAEGKHPWWSVEWKAVFNNEPDNEGTLRGHMYWLGMHMPLTKAFE